MCNMELKAIKWVISLGPAVCAETYLQEEWPVQVPNIKAVLIELLASISLIYIRISFISHQLTPLVLTKLKIQTVSVISAWGICA